MEIVTVLIMPDNIVRCYKSLDDARLALVQEMENGKLIFEEWTNDDDYIDGIMVYVRKPCNSRLSEVLTCKITSRTV